LAFEQVVAIAGVVQLQAPICCVRGFIDRRAQANMRKVLRSDTPPRASQLRQSAPVPSTEESKAYRGRCRACG
jgi:hypothetical protein